MSAKRKEVPAYERRLKESNRLIRLGLYRNAVESASGGIELLMQALFDEFRDKLLNTGEQADRDRWQHFTDCYNDLKENTDPKEIFTFDKWIRYYKDNLFGELPAMFDRYEFTHFKEETLYDIKQLRNKCVHDDYQPSRDEAESVCNYLASFLKETKRASGARQDHEWTKDWHQEWDEQIENWLKQPNNKKPQGEQIVSALADQLRLIVDLIDDEDVPRKLKTQLMWAVIYVIEPDDLIPEKHDEVPTLDDDAAVLAFTLYWLVNVENIKPETLHKHWRGKRDVIKVIKNRYRRINNEHRLFKPEQWKIIDAIAEKGPRVLWQMLK